MCKRYKPDPPAMGSTGTALQPSASQQFQGKDLKNINQEYLVLGNWNVASVSHNRQERLMRVEREKLVGDLSPTAGTGAGGKKSSRNQDISGYFPRSLEWGISRSWSTNSSQSVPKCPSWLTINDSPEDTAWNMGKCHSGLLSGMTKAVSPPSPGFLPALC